MLSGPATEPAVPVAAVLQPLLVWKFKPMAEQLAGAMGISPESLSDFKPPPVGAADTEPDPLSGTDIPPAAATEAVAEASAQPKAVVFKSRLKSWWH